MKKYLRFYSLFILLAACSGVTVEKIPLAQPEYPPENAQPSPIAFNKVHYAIPTGTTLASYSPRGLLGFLNCAGPYGTAEGGIRSRNFPDDNFREIFLNTMKAEGFDVAGDPGRMFDEQEDQMRAIYSVGARVTDIKIDLCRQVNFWGIAKGDAGEAAITIEWSVFDLLHRRNVYKTVTKGYAKRDIPNYDGIALLIEDSFAASAHNLGADKSFYDLVFNGMTPQDAPMTVEDPFEEPATIYNADEKVVLDSQALSRVPAQDQMEQMLHVTVMIQAANTHGSGFFITRQGHILTNAHVVGNATRVRVVTSGKNDKLVAEVLRLDRRRDVALLRLENMPENMMIEPLPMRLEKPGIGEDVYAVGSPYHTRLQDTVTKGIVSAHRMDARERQPYIQADVAVYGGNSGGPLVDQFGNVVGMSVSGYNDGDVQLSALNNFIPIGEALRRLEIGVEEASP